MSTPQPSARLARAITDALAPAYLVMGILLIVGRHSTGDWAGLGWGLLATLFCGGIPASVRSP
ncbi:hypothetical protein OG242_08150 [Streptomyces sp. NBC_00727]|uniref:hypothetical protein n=1 Tax=Streptomyces sp. NBC_00727 TaxID=2903675 RepID=UPI003863EDD6